MVNFLTVQSSFSFYVTFAASLVQPIRDCEKKQPSGGIYIPITQFQFLPEKKGY